MDFFRFFRTTPRGPKDELPTLHLHDAQETLRTRTVELIRPGFVSLDVAVQAAGEFAEHEELPFRPDEVERIVTATWDDLADCQRDWVSEGDYESLHEAFQDLEQAGIVSRMNFACCQNCGHAEIEDEREVEQQLGYVFFHEQDAERLTGDDAVLYLAYGIFTTHPVIAAVEAASTTGAEERAARVKAAEVQVGRLVATTLRSHGLVVEWDEQPSSRIEVQVANWRKRLPRG